MELNKGLHRAHRALFLLYLTLFVLLGFTEAMFIIRGETPQLFLPAILGLVMFAHWYAAKGAAGGQPWGRTLSRVIGCILLLGIPVGTVIGIYLLVQTGKKWQSATTPAASAA